MVFCHNVALRLQRIQLAEGTSQRSASGIPRYAGDLSQGMTSVLGVDCFLVNSTCSGPVQRSTRKYSSLRAKAFDDKPFENSTGSEPCQRPGCSLQIHQAFFENLPRCRCASFCRTYSLKLQHKVVIEGFTGLVRHLACLRNIVPQWPGSTVSNFHEGPDT